MSYFSQVATTIWLWTCWLGVTLFLVCAFLLVTPGLAVWFALDFLPKRKSKPLTSPAQPLRKLPRLYRPRCSGDIFAEFPDGTVIQLEPMEVKLYAMDCFEVIASALVWEQTKLPHKD